MSCRCVSGGIGSKEKKARLVDQEKYASELKFLQKQMSEVKLRFIEQKKK